MTLNGVEYELIEWAEIGEEGGGHPACHGNRDLDEEQLGIIKEACAVPLAEASITEHKRLRRSQRCFGHTESKVRS